MIEFLYPMFFSVSNSSFFFFSTWYTFIYV